jgi:PQQ enzyme repeat
MRKPSFIALVFIRLVLVVPVLLVSVVAGEAAGQSPAAISDDTSPKDQAGPVIGEDSAASPLAVQILAGKVAVTTYHYDNQRTGWNNLETKLSAANFASNFGILATAALDDQVDAQPLIVPYRVIAGSPGLHDVVYVVTESNTVYAIDASTGAILLSRNLGSPVPSPLGCNNNGPNVGINSTPVIDFSRQTLYAIAYVNLSGDPNNPNPSYQLHALNLSSLQDRIKPVTVAASHILTDGSTFTFNATYQRQRVGLLGSNGNIYAGFSSFCDFAGNLSRGWLLGWNAGTLAPLAANQLNDRQTTDPGVDPPFFLSSIWMSGFGIAAEGTDVYFATGNSDCDINVSPTACPPASSWDGKTNIQESVVRLKGTLTGIDGIFAPSDVFYLDQNDNDLGSGGVLLLPTLSGKSLAVAGGKDGNLYLLNAQSLSTPLDTQQLAGGCWCGPSYFMGPDGIGRIVTSNGSTVQTWQVQLSPSAHLVSEGTAAIPPSEQDPGFFTVVSSNGIKAGSAIIWAVERPTGADPTNPTAVNLYAFAAAANPDGSLTQLFSAPAGSWPNTGGNANIVPVVANGKVYVASYQTLTIFGPGATSAAAIAAQKALSANPVASPKSPRVLSGKLLEVSGSTLTLEMRTGESAKVDASQAIKDRKVGTPLKLGVPLTVLGSSANANGALEATAIIRAKGPSGKLWPLDR